MSAHTEALLASIAIKQAQRDARLHKASLWSPAPWQGMHGGRKAEAFTSADAYVGDSALYMPSAAPDGALSADRANEGWSGAWSRRNTTRAGKSERKSMLVGSQRGARRGETC